MIKVLLKTNIRQMELDGSPVRYETFLAVLERPLAEEDQTAVLEEIEKTGNGFIQALPEHGEDPIWIRASAVSLVKFIEAEETE